MTYPMLPYWLVELSTELPIRLPVEDAKLSLLDILAIVSGCIE